MTAERSLSRVLVANRGEIAVRIIRAARDEGLTSVAVYAEPDRHAFHVRLADQAVSLRGATAADTYLSIPRLLEAAAATGADAVHPGYGFLAESADFAQAVLDAGLTWIGPDPAAIEALGDKVRARALAHEAGAPLVAGTPGPVRDAEEVVFFAREHGLPVAIKAAFGGGGRGLRVARTLEEIPELFAAAQREATAAFGRGECFAERFLEPARHVEAQVLADDAGRVVVVGLRDCSLQRRHQKLVEEAPAPFLTDEQEQQIAASAREICARAGYTGAGTVEYLVGADGTVSFLEVNTRLQVEHPVTEETTGIDLVRQMFRIARGQPLELPDRPPSRGHAIEFRINGEDPGRGFLPAPGTVSRLVWPAGPGVRIDAGVEPGDPVAAGFDSLLAKIVVHAATREEALERSRRVLDETVLEGVVTVLPFHRAVVRDAAFTGEGDAFSVHTRWIEEEFASRLPAPESADDPGVSLTVSVGGRQLAVTLPGLDRLPDRARILASARAAATDPSTGSPSPEVRPPMQGTVVRVAVTEGQRVVAGDLLLVVEAMKMETSVLAHQDGTVTDLAAVAGQGVSPQMVLLRLLPAQSRP